MMLACSQTLDSWDFAIFEAEALTTQQPLRYIGHELFKRYNLFSDHKVRFHLCHYIYIAVSEK